MPNYCNNNIVITGPNSVIDKIEKIANGDKGDLLQYFYPMPEALKDTTAPLPKDATKEEKAKAKENLKKYGYDNWYDWRVENWGTKWDIMEFYNINRKEIGEDESEISLGFDTAWAPALGAYEKFIDENSNCSLKAYYYEPGCDFMGEWDNGIDSCFEVAKYGLDDDFWKQGIGSTLDDYFGITESMAQYLEDTMMDEEVYKYSKGEKVNIGEDA
jgi:hypothetical protein|tara:strand:+ start:1559 stop:2203 length:645 start_codon:yes stop_codon:yes gene_type:complete